jgi:hypothetical protein
MLARLPGVAKLGRKTASAVVMTTRKPRDAISGL